MAQYRDQVDWEATVRQVAYRAQDATQMGESERGCLGISAIVIGVLAGIVAFATVGVGVKSFVSGDFVSGGGGVFKLAMFLAPVACLLGWRLLASSATKQLSRDKRQPVLLLRPFEEDETRIFRAKVDKFEQHLAKSLSRIGPVIAVAKPYEHIPPLGAHRIELNPHGESWKEAVITLIGISRLVVVRCSARMGEGTLWELQMLLESTPPEKILIALPRKSTDTDLQAQFQYREFFRQTRALFPKPLPEYSNGALFLAFDADRNVKALAPIKVSWWQEKADPLDSALEPHLRALGISQQKQNP